ncbi:hypothetical protein GALMADRAFT_273440 [Galerina marginata CBS 339.88]|uniref:Uncharacterized protein n=1 Tax=Galerina marginata (strain CBS 339.88) TaxID=685588 RepID=A0A067SA13_GALM3|nr:hypothetical protein GALMADRAFT_273440 [Galerina marginata CBS 339.88]
MAPPPTQLRNNSKSPTPSDSENIPVLSMNTSQADLLKLRSCDRVSEIARRYEADKNEAQAKLNRLSRKFADITNDDDDNSGHSGRPKRRRTRHESPSADSEEDEVDSGRTASDERFVYQAGHKFFLLCGPWIRSGDDLLDTNIDEHYNTAERFEKDENKVQGQFREILDLLQQKFQQQALRQRWLRRQFMNVIKAQRYNTASRIRHSCASILGASESDIFKPEVRKAKFREEIGWVCDTGLYSSVDVPILHKGWSGEYSLSAAFLNPKLMGARWALSSDDTLQEVGSTTGIRYFKDFEEYLEILETGLRQKKKSVIGIIKQWDKKIFPNSESSLVAGQKNEESSGLKKVMELLAADSEEDDSQQDGNEEVGAAIQA